MKKSRPRRSRRPGICRIDQDSTRTHGFFARYGWYRRRDGSYVPRYRAFFGDASHGGKRKALRAAETWMKKVVAVADKGKPKRRGSAGRRRAA